MLDWIAGRIFGRVTIKEWTKIVMYNWFRFTKIRKFYFAIDLAKEFLIPGSSSKSFKSIPPSISYSKQKM